jgi:hypothetical protein
MEEPTVIVDVFGIDKWIPVVPWADTSRVIKDIESVISLIGQLEIAATAGNDDVDLFEIAGLASDLNWHMSDLSTAIVVLQDYAELPDIMDVRERELASRITDDEQEEFDQQMIMYKLKVGK